jgi:hypothetical protein
VQVSGLPRTDGATELVSPPPAADSADDACTRTHGSPLFYSVSLSGNTINTSSQPTMDLKNCYSLTCTAGLAVAAAGRIAPEDPFIEWRFVVQCRQLARRIAVRLDVRTGRAGRSASTVHPGADCGPPAPEPGAGGDRGGRMWPAFAGTGSGRGGRMWRAHVCGGGETAAR